MASGGHYKAIGRYGWKLIVGLGIIAALVVSVIQLRDRLSGTPDYVGSVAQRDGAQDFIEFLESHDGSVVKLDVSCDSSPGGTCESTETVDLWVAPDGVENAETPYAIDTVTDATSDVQVDNGEFGAGGLVIKGRFSVLVKGELGSTLPGVQNIQLRGLSAEAD
jgi:hypothetical protein